MHPSQKGSFWRTLEYNVFTSQCWYFHRETNTSFNLWPHRNLLAWLHSLWNSLFFTVDCWTRQTITLNQIQLGNFSIFLKQKKGVQLHLDYAHFISTSRWYCQKHDQVLLHKDFPNCLRQSIWIWTLLSSLTSGLSPKGSPNSLSKVNLFQWFVSEKLESSKQHCKQ